jgi:hypothetical protein
LEELGHAVRTVSPRLPRLGRAAPGIHGGLQVVENWNSGNTVITYGKDGVLNSADREHS